MTAKQENPPAFPGQMDTGLDQRAGNFNQGMTMRDYFAGIALGALLTQGNARRVSDTGWGGRAYEIADAMLEARESYE